MTRSLLRRLQPARPCGRGPHAWSGVCLTVALMLSAMAFSGCEKPPTFSELINGKKKEPPPSTPAPVANTAPTAQVHREPPKAPEIPKRAPQEVIAEFNATPSQQRTDKQIQELASNPEAADQFTELNLTSANGISDAGIALLPKFEHVERLSIDNCQYTNAALVNVAKMKSLTWLSMNGGVIKEPTSDSGLAAIKQMHQLTSLSLEGANITPKGLESIAEMDWLESLNVARTRFNDDSLKLLSPLVNLKELNISYTLVSDSAFEYLLPFHQMETLKIARLPINGRGLKGLGQSGAMPNLHTLVMFSNPGLELSGYEGIYAFKKTLQSLDVGQSALTDDRFIHGVVPCTKLEVLLVHDNPSISDAGMQQISKLKKLKRLYFFKNPGITDLSLNYIVKLRSLESVTFNATSVSALGAQNLKKHLKKCDVVYNDKRVE